MSSTNGPRRLIRTVAFCSQIFRISGLIVRVYRRAEPVLFSLRAA
jgi:hypothetical protein